MIDEKQARAHEALVQLEVGPYNMEVAKLMEAVALVNVVLHEGGELGFPISKLFHDVFALCGSLDIVLERRITCK